MKAGALSRRIKVQSRAGTQDALGQPVETWSDTLSAWADVRTRGGLETIRDDREQPVGKVSFRIRYRTGITTAQRVVFNGVNYAITAVLHDERGREYTDLACEVLP